MNSVEAAESVFEPVALGRIADAAVDQIEQLILSGVLRPGQKLPPERELSETLGISRPKLREAFQTLVERGLLEIRRSEGAFVQPLAGPSLSPALVSLFARHRAAFRDFLEFRRAFESFAAALAAERATEADRELLARLIEEMEAARRDHEAEREAELDMAFHERIAELSHNAMVIHVLRSVCALKRHGDFYDRATLMRDAEAGERLILQHREIAEAILAGDADAAAEASERHIDFVAQAFLRSEEQDRRLAVARKRQSLALLPTGDFARRRR